MAVRTSRKIVIDAPPEAIMDALADVESLPSYSPATNEEIFEYHWGPDWLV